MEESPAQTLVQDEVNKLSQAMDQLLLKRPSSVKQLKREIVTEMAAIDRSIQHIANPRLKRKLSREYLTVQNSLSKLEAVTSFRRKPVHQSSFVGSYALQRPCTPSRPRRNNCRSCLQLLSSGIGTSYCPRHGLNPRRL